MGKWHVRVSRFVLVVAATVLPAACMYSSVKHPAGKPTLAEELKDDTVAFVMVTEQKGEDDLIVTEKVRPFCTGVWISNDMILTAGHCVRDAGKTEERRRAEHAVHLFDLGLELAEWDPVGQQMSYSMLDDMRTDNTLSAYRSSVVMVYDKAEDLALVRADHSNMMHHPYAVLSSSDIRDGDEVNVVGHPRGMMWSYTKGWVGASRYIEGPHDYPFRTLQVSAAVTFGNSGGGAFDADGRLIGICSYIMPAIPNASFFVHRDVIKEFLSHNKVHGY